MTIQTLPLAVIAVQQQAIRLCAQMKTIAQVDQVFELVSKLISMLDDLDPVSSAIYETVLERRTALLKARQEKYPPPQSYYPVRVKSEQSRAQAASGKRNPERWARKRRLGDMAALPPHVRDCFTEGERAVLYIVTADIRQHGSCRCTNKEIGDRAGVGLTTTRNALRKACQRGLLSIQNREQWRGKNLANIIRIKCESWLNWLTKFRPRLGFNYPSKGVKKPAPSETFSKENQNKQPAPYSKDTPTGDFQPFANRKPAFE